MKPFHGMPGKGRETIKRDLVEQHTTAIRGHHTEYQKAVEENRHSGMRLERGNAEAIARTVLQIIKDRIGENTGLINDPKTNKERKKRLNELIDDLQAREREIRGLLREMGIQIN